MMFTISICTFVLFVCQFQFNICLNCLEMLRDQRNILPVFCFFMFVGFKCCLHLSAWFHIYHVIFAVLLRVYMRFCFIVNLTSCSINLKSALFFFRWMTEELLIWLMWPVCFLYIAVLSVVQRAVHLPRSQFTGNYKQLDLAKLVSKESNVIWYMIGHAVLIVVLEAGF